MKYITVTKLNLEDYLHAYDVLVCQIRQSRIKAKQWAALEMSTLLSPLDAIFITNSPIGDAKGIISYFVPKGAEDALKGALKNCGYCQEFFMLDFTLKKPTASVGIQSINPYIWKGKRFALTDFYAIDKDAFESQSIMNRLFAVYQQDFTVKYVKGYRGDGSDAGRRALPLEDARLMVNLVSPKDIYRLLDPFAGGGGILLAAKHVDESLYLTSADIDRVVEPGLKMYAHEHHTCDARELVIDGQVDAIVTEVPFSTAYTDIIIDALDNVIQYLADDGRLVLMCHMDQFLMIGGALPELYPIFYKDIDRKGTPITISYWTKSREFYESMQGYVVVLREIL